MTITLVGLNNLPVLISPISLKYLIPHHLFNTIYYFIIIISSPSTHYTHDFVPSVREYNINIIKSIVLVIVISIINIHFEQHWRHSQHRKSSLIPPRQYWWSDHLQIGLIGDGTIVIIIITIIIINIIIITINIIINVITIVSVLNKLSLLLIIILLLLLLILFFIDIIIYFPYYFYEDLQYIDMNNNTFRWSTLWDGTQSHIT